jgi:hypothetical protein
MTPYHFVSNNPINRIDPDGRWDWYQSTDNTTVKWFDGDGYQEGYSNIGASNVITSTNTATGEVLGLINLNDDGSATNAQTGEFATSSISGNTKIEANLEASSLRSMNSMGQDLAMSSMKSVGMRVFGELINALYPADNRYDAPKIQYPNKSSSVERSDVQFGNPNTSNQTSHANRYLEKAGMNVQKVKDAIKADLKPSGSYETGVRIEGTVKVDGVKVNYSGVRLPDGTINIGSIKPPRL